MPPLRRRACEPALFAVQGRVTAKFLIDANLPYRFSVWQGPDYVHVLDLNDRWADWEIGDYAKTHGLTIATKDADFYNRITHEQVYPHQISQVPGSSR